MSAGEGASKPLILYSGLAAAMTATAWAYGILFDRAELLRNFLVPFSFLGLGALIKYGDQAFDIDAYSKRTTMLLALPGGLWMGSLIAVDDGSATIFVGLLLALWIARKYDNLAFKVGSVTALIIGIASLAAGIGSLAPLGAVIVLVAAFLDERANDLPGVDEGRTWKAVLFHHRPFLKIAILVLCVVGLLPSYLYFFSFLAFDFGYAMVEAMSVSVEVPAIGRA